jgi:hypothetical protein
MLLGNLAHPCVYQAVLTRDEVHLSFYEDVLMISVDFELKMGENEAFCWLLSVLAVATEKR